MGRSCSQQIILSKKSIRTYGNFEIPLHCRRCGKQFKVGDEVIKNRPSAYNSKSRFYCLDHFYAESLKTDVTGGN
jgi:hypothetical protein